MNNSINITGSVTKNAGDLVLIGDGVTVGGAISVPGTVVLNGGAGNVVAENSANSFGGLVALIGNAISVRATGDLDVLLLSSGANAAVDLRATGALDLPMFAISTGTADLTLVAGTTLSTSQALSGNVVTLSAGTGLTVSHSITAAAGLNLSFGQSAAGAFTLASGGSLSAGATVTGGAFDDAVTLSVSPASAITFNLGAGSNSLVLTGGNDSATITAANTATFGSATINDLSSINGLAGSDTLVNAIAGSAFDAETASVGGIAVTGFETVNTALLTLTAGNDTFIITGAGTGSHTGGLLYTGLTSVDAAGGTADVLNNLTLTAFSAGTGPTGSVGGITVTGFETVDTALLTLTGSDNSFMITGLGSALHIGGLSYSGLTSVDASGSTADLLLNSTGAAFSAGPGTSGSVAGISVMGFEVVNTAALFLTGSDDIFTITGAGTGSHTGGLSYTGLTSVDALGATADVLVNSTGGAFSAGSGTVAGITVTGFETVNTAALFLTGSDDVFTITGAGTGSHAGGLSYTGLTSVDALGATADVLVNSTGGAFSASSGSLGGITLAGFEIVNTAELTLTGSDDIFTITGAGTGSHTGGLLYTGLTSVDALGAAADSLINSSGSAFTAGSGTSGSAGGITVTGFETVSTAALVLTGNDDTFTITGLGTGSHNGGLLYTGLTSVDALGATADSLINSSGSAFTAGSGTSGSAGGITVTGFETVGTAALVLTGSDDIFTITGLGTGSHTGGLLYTGLTSVDALGAAADSLINSSGSAFTAGSGTSGSAGGITVTGFETVSTAALVLTGSDDTFTITGLGTGSHTGGLLYTGLTSVDALSHTTGDLLINSSGSAFSVGPGTSGSAGGITVTGFETVSTAALTLTGSDDTFTITGLGTGSHTGGLSYTDLTSVDAQGHTIGDLLVNSTGSAFSAASSSVGGITVAGFETVNTAALTLTGNDDIFTITGSGTGTHTGGLNYTGLTSVDALGHTTGDLLVNSTAIAFDTASLTVGVITVANFEIINSASIALGGGDDIFTITAPNTGSHSGGLTYTGLINIDGGGGADTLRNDIVAEAFSVNPDLVTGSVGGITASGFETVNTSLLTLTAGNDVFTITDIGMGSHTGGLSYTGLTSVNALGHTTGDLLVNSTGSAFSAASSSVGGITATGFETVNTAALTLTGNDDIFTVTGANAGTHTGGLNYIGLTSVDALGHTVGDLLVNSTGGAFAAQTNTVAGINAVNFETVSTSLLTLTLGDDVFNVTGANSGIHAGGLNYIGLTSVNALGHITGDRINLLAAAQDDSIQVNPGSNSATTSGITFSAIEVMDAGIGNDSVTLTGGDDDFLVTGSGAGITHDIQFLAIENVDGAAGTDTFTGTSASEAWVVSGVDAGSVSGLDFNSFSQLRSGGGAIDRFTFLAGANVTSLISGDGGNLQFINSGTTTTLTGAVRAAGLRLTSTAGGSFDIKNTTNAVTTLSADLDGFVRFSDSNGFTVGLVDGVTGVTTTGDQIELGALGSGNITLDSDVTTGSRSAGNVLIGRPVVLARNVAVTGGNVTFGGTIGGLFSLAANSTGETRFNGSVTIQSLATDADGTTFLGSTAPVSIVTLGSQTYGDDVRLVQDASVSGTDVLFAGTVDADASGPARGLGVTAGTATFNGFVGGSAALSLLQVGGGTVFINGGGVTTTGIQDYLSAVRLGADTTLAGGGDISFGSTVDSAGAARALFVNSPGTVTFGSSVGSLLALRSLTTDLGGETILGSGGAMQVTTTEDQIYGDDVVLDSSTTLSSRDVTFARTVSGSGPFSLTVTHNAGLRSVTFGGKVSGLTDLTIGNGTSFIRDTDGSLELENILEADLLGALDVVELSLSGSIGTAGEFRAINTANQIDILSFDGATATVGTFRLLDAGVSGRPSSGITGLAAPGLVLTGTADVGVTGTAIVLTEGGIHAIRQGTESVKFNGTGDVILIAGVNPGDPGTNEFRSNADTGANISGTANLYIVANSIGTEMQDGVNYIGSDFSGMVVGGSSPFASSEFNYSLPGSDPSTLVITPLAGFDFGSPDALHLFGAGPVIDIGGADVAALVRAFFNDFLSTTNLISGDAESIVEIGQLARFESGLFPPLYGPFSVTSYEHEWYGKEVGGQVPDDKLYYRKRYPLYLKQHGKPPGKVQYDSIIEE